MMLVKMKTFDKIRLLIAILEIIILLIFSVYLLVNYDTSYGGGLLACLLMSLVLLPLYVFLSRQTRIWQDVTWTNILTVSPFILSGPSTILQLVIIWSGVHQTEVTVLTSPELSGWGWGWLQFILLTVSVSSLCLASLSYTNDHESRRLIGAINIVINTIYRLFIISILFKISPVTGIIFLMITYSIQVCVHYSYGDGRHSLMLAYCNLMTPTGLCYGICSNTQTSPPPILSSSSEMERVRINQKGLLPRLKRFIFSSWLYSSFLIFIYLICLEAWLYPYPDLYPAVSSLIYSRLFTYTLSITFLILGIITSIIFFISVRNGVNEKLAKDDISTPSSPSTPMKPEIKNDATLNIVDEKQTDDERLYPTLPTAPEPPYNPYYQPPAGPSGDVQIAVGNRKCENSSCVTCVKMIEGPKFSSSVTGVEYIVIPRVSCTTDHLIYLITCIKCSKQYVGKTEQSLKQRHYGHRREVEHASSALGQHFSSTAGRCGAESLNIQIIEACHRDGADLLGREGYWQHELQTFSPSGINIRDELGGRNKV